MKLKKATGFHKVMIFFFFYMGMSKRSDTKIPGQTKTMLCDAFTAFIDNMLTVLPLLLYKCCHCYFFNNCNMPYFGCKSTHPAVNISGSNKQIQISIVHKVT